MTLNNQLLKLSQTGVSDARLLPLPTTRTLISRSDTLFSEKLLSESEATGPDVG